MTAMKRTISRAFMLATAITLIAALAISAATLAEPKNLDSNAKAKNIILLISDGCGYNQIIATDYYQYGKTGTQVYEEFPIKIAMSTYEVEKDSLNNPIIYGYDSQKAWSDFNYVRYDALPQNTTDSASAATAMSTGTKTYNGYIGVDANGNPLTHLIQIAEQKGKSTGVITSVELSHATPAGFVAHNTSRNNYLDIAKEMIYSSGIDVIMGAGNPDFDDDGLPAQKDAKYVGGATTWADLKDADSALGADANGDGVADRWTLIQDRSAFQNLATGNTPSRLIGVAKAYTTLQQSRTGNQFADPFVVPLTATVPNLEEMTKAALNVLDNNEKGFFLMIEGGAVDWASHARQSGRMIEEQIDFNRSVEAVVDWVQKYSNWGETLVIVTGDHETGYLSGPGSGPVWYSGPVWNHIVNNGRGVLPGMQWCDIRSGSTEHTNSLIPLFAKGDVSHLLKAYAEQVDTVRGNYMDNTEIAKVIIGLLNE